MCRDPPPPPPPLLSVSISILTLLTLFTIGGGGGIWTPAKLSSVIENWCGPQAFNIIQFFTFPENFGSFVGIEETFSVISIFISIYFPLFPFISTLFLLYFTMNSPFASSLSSHVISVIYILFPIISTLFLPHHFHFIINSSHYYKNSHRLI